MSYSFTAPRMRYEDIADELSKMNLDEQDALRGDLFGERPPVNENEEMINNAIKELKEYVETIHPKEAYETAQIICPDYVNSVDFCLMFLRCERFDVAKAAQRIVQYWDQKVDVWGEDKAFRRLTIDEFDQEDQTALTMGGVKILPERDDAGRGIVFVHRANWDKRRTHRNSMVRLFWYIAEAALEDVDVQRKGAVWIFYNGQPSYDHLKYDPKLGRKLCNIFRRALSMRCVAGHHIISSSLIKLLSENATYWIGPEYRIRYKQHSGIKDEYLESFSTYGIQPTMIPQLLGGGLEFDYEQWLRDRRAQGR